MASGRGRPPGSGSRSQPAATGWARPSRWGGDRAVRLSDDREKGATLSRFDGRITVGACNDGRHFGSPVRGERRGPARPTRRPSRRRPKLAAIAFSTYFRPANAIRDARHSADRRARHGRSACQPKTKSKILKKSEKARLIGYGVGLGRRKSPSTLAYLVALVYIGLYINLFEHYRPILYDITEYGSAGLLTFRVSAQLRSKGEHLVVGSSLLSNRAATTR